MPFEDNELEMTVAAGASTNTVPVLIVQSDSVDDVARTCVTAGGSTVMVWVLMQGVEVEAESPITTAAVVPATAATPAAVDVATAATPAALDVATAAAVVAAALTTVDEIILPVTVTDTGTLTVAVMVAGVALAVAVEAALPQDSFWEVHSSSEKPGPERAIQALN